VEEVLELAVKLLVGTTTWHPPSITGAANAQRARVLVRSHITTRAPVPANSLVPRPPSSAPLLIAIGH